MNTIVSFGNLKNTFFNPVKTKERNYAYCSKYQLYTSRQRVVV